MFRASNPSDLLNSIGAKLEKMITDTTQQNGEVSVVLSKVHTSISKDVISELKKQTSLLQKIEAGLGKSKSGGFFSGINNNEAKTTEKMFGSLAKHLPKMIKAADGISNKTAENIEGFFNSLSSGIEKLAKNKETFKDFADIAKTLITSLPMFILKLTGALVLFAIAAPIVLIGVGALVVVSAALGFSFKLLSKHNKDIQEGAQSIKSISTSLLILGVGVLALALVVNTIGPAQIATSIIALGAIAGIFVLVGKFSKPIIKGARAIGIAALSLGLLGLGIAVFGLTSIESVGLATLSIAAIGGVFWLIGKLGSEVIKGSLVMAFAGIALLPVAIGIGALHLATLGMTFEDVGVMGAVLGGLGTVMGIAGLAFPFVALGAAQFMIAGIALLSIGAGLGIFKAIKFNQEDGDNLKFALGSVVEGFLGGEIPGGIIGGLKFAGALAARTAMLLIAIPPMILAGAALIPLSLGLGAFKLINFKKSDAENLNFAISSVVKGFGIIYDKDLQAEYGINVDPTDLAAGISSLMFSGITLVSLAAGIKAFANLEFVENEVKGGKLVAKSVRKLTPADFEMAGQNISKVVGFVGGAFASIGKLERGGALDKTLSAFNPLSAIGFGPDGDVAAGVDSLSGVGKVLSSLADGVKSFANLEIIEYEVKNGKLVPKSVRKLTKEDFQAAGENISTIVTSIAGAFAAVGKMERGGTLDKTLAAFNPLAMIGFGPDGDVAAGVKALGGVGDIISTLATGVKSYSDLRFDTYELQNGKLVLTDSVTMSDTLIKKSTANITMVLTSTMEAMVSASKYYKDNQDEIDEIIKLGDMVSYVDAIVKMGESKTTSNIQKVEGSMKLIKEHINGMDLKKLTLTSGMMNSLAILSKTPEAISQAVAESIETVFEELINAIKELNGGEGATDNNTKLVNEPIKLNGPNNTGPEKPATSAVPPPEPPDMSGIERRLDSILGRLNQRLDVKVKEY